MADLCRIIYIIEHMHVMYTIIYLKLKKSSSDYLDLQSNCFKHILDREKLLKPNIILFRHLFF